MLAPDQWARVRSLLEEIMARPAEERAAYLAAANINEPDIRREVESLLRAHDDAGDFLEATPTLGLNTLTQQRLGDFVIGREIGRGGMGVVYEARQTSLNRLVALKVLSTSAGLTPKGVQRFHHEAEAAAKLHHTNIVPIYATGEQDGTHFYAMELIEGTSLDQVIRQLHQLPTDMPAPSAAPGDAPDASTITTTGPYMKSPRPSSSTVGRSPSSRNYFNTLARMIAEVAEALDYAHQQGVIHRDIKPSNLLLSPAGRLSVTDFGVARMLEQPGMTITGEMVGTPLYMSPEQITAGRVPIDHRTDIYSLAATLYELLTLRPPFVAEERDQLLAQIIQKDPTPPRRVNGTVPVDLETICLKAMDKDPDRRYQTAGAMAEDLRRYVNRFAILARRPGPFARLQKWVIRNSALSAALAAVVLCVAVAGGFAYRSHLRDRAHSQELTKVEQERLEEIRRAALEKAFLAVRLEDFDGARHAIRDAERLGCSAGQVNMLQGQLELYQGHDKEAIDHLTKAVDLLPESVAAWSMLSVAKMNAGRPTEAEQAMTRATELVAQSPKDQSPEDYLFRGYAETHLDIERGLRSLDEAIRRRPSVLARLMRLNAVRRHLLDVPGPERARQAMEDAKWIKQYLPDHPVVLSESLLTHLSCSHVFGEFGPRAERQAALEEGWKDVRALERFPNLPAAVLARWTFVEGTDQEETVLDDLRRVTERTGDATVGANYAMALYNRGKYDQAYTIMLRKKGETVLDLIRVIYLTELPGGVPRAHQLLEEVTARDLGQWDLFNSQLILRFLGRKQEAIEVSRKFLALPDRFPAVRKEPFRRALEYCAGQRSEEDLLHSMKTSRLDLSNAHISIALSALADGDRKKARRHLQRCLDTRYFAALPYSLCLSLLARMGKDPAWPPWIELRP